MNQNGNNIKSDIDSLWLEFYSGGITNPITVIEQITFLMFARLLDIKETRNEKRANRLGQGYEGIFINENDERRWKNFKDKPADELMTVVRDKVFPMFRDLAKAGTSFGEYMENATLMVQRPKTLVSAVDIISKLPLTRGDTKGDLYEYMLSKLNTAGISGQFRTPRHIIQLMVKMLNPKPDDRVCDPACGTAGFLTETMNYLQEKYTSDEGKFKDEDETVHYTGDLLDPYRDHIQKGLITGFDFDATMLRISAMNLMVHGIDNPNVHYQDTLGTSFIENYPSHAKNGFDIILANPPFKGVIDASDVDPTLSGKVKTKKTELLFPVLMLRMLKTGGRCAVIVPDGVLFGASKAHMALRKMLIEENQLEGVVSLPNGVFRPYAGVSTAVLFFTKGGKTENVWFYDLEDDGFSLNDKRTQLYEDTFAGDLPKCLEAWKGKDEQKDSDRSNKAFFVPVDELVKNKYDLSINRYKEIVYEEEEYEQPVDIINNSLKIDNEIIEELNELKNYLNE
jgi:type I restriction enzyme M protein